MKLKLTLIIAILATFMLALNTGAQEDDPQPEPQHPLLDMLALVPNTPRSVNGLIMFSDWLAVEAAYPGTKKVTSWAEFDALGPDNDELIEQTRWWKVFINMLSNIGPYLLASEDAPEVVGFDLFEVDRVISYGSPPEQVLALQGGFDMAAVRAAFGNQGFTQEADGTDSVELWCGPDGCDAGLETSLSEHNPANPFGGELGRKQPLVIGEDYLLSSPSIGVVEDHLDVLAGGRESLADLPEYQAVVAALIEQGVVIQASFIDGEMLGQLADSSLMVNSGRPLEPEQQRALLETMLEEYETLPAPELIAFADVTTETEQVGVVALVYDNVDDAEHGTEIVKGRLESYSSVRAQRPFADILEERRVPFLVPIVYEYSPDVMVGILQLPTQKATGDQILEVTEVSISPEDRPDLTPPGLIYRFLVDAVFARDLAWVSTVPREELEAELEALGG